MQPHISHRCLSKAEACHEWLPSPNLSWFLSWHPLVRAILPAWVKMRGRPQAHQLDGFITRDVQLLHALCPRGSLRRVWEAVSAVPHRCFHV